MVGFETGKRTAIVAQLHYNIVTIIRHIIIINNILLELLDRRIEQFHRLPLAKSPEKPQLFREINNIRQHSLLNTFSVTHSVPQSKPSTNYSRAGKCF